MFYLNVNGFGIQNWLIFCFLDSPFQNLEVHTTLCGCSSLLSSLEFFNLPWVSLMKNRAPLSALHQWVMGPLVRVPWQRPSRYPQIAS